MNQIFEKSVEEIIKSMTLEEKIAQMFFIKPETLSKRDSALYLKSKYVRGLVHRILPDIIKINNKQIQTLKDIPVGGVVLFERHMKNCEQLTSYINDLQRNSKYPLFIACDEEGGTVRRISRVKALGTTKTPDMCEIGAENDLQKAYDIGTIFAKDFKRLGLNVNFAPMADIHCNNENSLTKKRAFSSDTQIVSKMVGEIVKGMQENNLSATLKHYPGHGDTSVDSHKGLASSPADLKTLHNREFLPFKTGIAAGVNFIMVGHVALPNIMDEKTPCCLSKMMITDILKNELNFNNIVICDSLEMKALRKNKNVIRTAINAGIDMILMPPNLKKAIKTIKNDVLSGEISEERINDAVRRIINIKLKENIIKKS